MVETEGPKMTLQYSAYTLHAGLQGYMHVCACTHTHTLRYPHACTHRPIRLTVFRAKMIRERALVLHYIYIAPFLISSNYLATLISLCVD